MLAFCHKGRYTIKSELRALIADLLSDLIVERIKTANHTADIYLKRTLLPEKDFPYSEGCIDDPPIPPIAFSCDFPFECDPPSGNRFICVDNPSSPPKAFDCDYISEFKCKAKYFECTGDFSCTSGNEFHCDAEIHDCSSFKSDGDVGKFDCTGGAAKNFDCTDGKTFDFMCDRDPQGAPQGYECTDDDFACSPRSTNSA